MIRSYIRLGNLGRLLLSLVAGWLALMATSSQAQVTLNVTNFGARGDAVQFLVNTTSNSVVVTTTNRLSSADIGKAIEVFQAGTQTSGVDSYGNNTNGNQDLVATITNVVNGTNIYISILCQKSLTNTFATYGHNNQTNFQNAIAACGGATNAIINIPAGKYLFLCTYNATVFGNAGIILTGGGIHFVGAGTNSTTLLSQGAWMLKSGAVWRGFLIAIVTPITNDFPFSIENLTLDGGVQQGNMSATLAPGMIGNTVDGLGWDQTHDAIVIRGGGGNEFTHQTWTNVVFAHWRGEMVKSNIGSTNGNLSIFNCVFTDGNASAINVFASLNISNCVFANMFFVAEYYQAYSTNVTYFQNNFITNINYNCFAVNGGKGNNPPIVIRNNTFYLARACNGISTQPGDNVYVISNQFVCADYVTVFAIAPSGTQGTYENSNIVIAANTIVNPYTFVELNGGSSGYYPTNNRAIEGVTVYGNTLTQPDYLVNFLQTFGWTTNIHFYSNDLSTITNQSIPIFVGSGNYGSPIALIETNNLYWIRKQDTTGTTNYLNYASGSRFQVYNQVHPGTVYALTDTNSSQIPPGAQILVFNNVTTNSYFQTNSFPVYLNSALTRGPVNVASGQTLTAVWTNGTWATITSATNAPALNPVIQVTPGSISYGTVLSGTSKTNSFAVQNVGNGTLSGTASVGAPFSILSGGSYSLGTNQSQTVMVVFSPAVASNYSQNVSFSGGGGTNVNVSGSATNAPVLNPIIHVTPGSISYGTILSGTSKTNSFMVQNVGGGTLSGTASVGAPFNILSGGSYSLGSNQSQTVTMVFNPVMAGNYNQNVSFSGGGGTNTIVSGNATNVSGSLTVSAIGPNVPDADTNMAGFQVYVGTTVQLSASASSPGRDPVTWQWSYSLNGGTRTVYQSGSGTAPRTSFTYPSGTAGNIYAWTLQVTDSRNQLSVQSQLTLSVELAPPQRLMILSN